MLNTIKGTVRPLHDKVLVVDLQRGEQKTATGIVLLDDDASTRGIHPRWGKVYAKGHTNKDEYDIGNWVLIEHGRWTRAMNVESDDGVILEVRMIDRDGVIGWSNELPNDIMIGEEYSNGDSVTVRPEDFGAR
jgi:co-chaperonin GroES (HSP10)